MYKRILDLESFLNRKSVFLFGPRQTGKSTWLKENYPQALYINLLSRRTYDDYARRAEALESDLQLFQRQETSNIVIIDEVQKLPKLLDEVHNQIEANKKLRFILTGSSARKLKRESANLLGGRASWRNMFPLVYPEVSAQLTCVRDLERRLLVGGLPHVFDSTSPLEELDDYVQLYLNEEVKAEGLVRNYDAFNRFLTTSALCNAKQINFTQIGSDAQIPPRTAHDYFQILEDTLIGFMLPAFTDTPSRKAMTSAKFYLFDTGVVNGLLGRASLKAGTTEFGDLFEHFVISEIRAYLSYKQVKARLSYWRSQSKIEVDAIIQKQDGSMMAIEIKAFDDVSRKDVSGLLAFAEDFPSVKKIVVTLEGRRRIHESGTEIIPSIEFLKALWNGEIV